MYIVVEVVLKFKLWIYFNWLQKGEVIVFVFLFGVGKIILVCVLVVGIMKGEVYLLGYGLILMGMGYVIIVNKEDNVEIVFVFCLKVVGVDLNWVYFIGFNDGLVLELIFLFFNE